MTVPSTAPRAAAPRGIEVGRARTCRKVFLDGRAGASTEYWEVQWEGEVRRLRGPLARLLDEHLPAGSLLLESGCGQGEIAASLRDAGHRSIGIDLARRALVRCHERHRSLPLSVADVGRMPFADATFDAVVSLGVVEHFEAGPAALLAEHVRVLRPGGVFFLTVPMRSWYRRWSDVRHLATGRHDSYLQRGRLVTVRSATAVETAGPGRFHQYELSPPGVIDLCRDAGLDVVTWQPFGVADALSDSPLLARVAAAVGAGGAPVATSDDGPSPETDTDGHDDGRRTARAALRRAVIDEAGTGVMAPVTWTVTRAMGHMQLVVARRPAASGGPVR